MTRGRLVLAMDASTDTCSVAVLEAGGSGFQEVCSRHIQGGRETTRKLLSFAGEVLDEIGAGQEDLGAVVVGAGPGTFTGVRIAVATARGLALALDIPVSGVSTLSALAAGAAATAGGLDVLAAVVDAHRGQVFGAAYRLDDGLWTRCGGIFAVEPAGVIEEVARRAGSGRTLIVGKVESISTAGGGDGVDSKAAPVLRPEPVRAACLLQGHDAFAGPEGRHLVGEVRAWLAAGVGPGAATVPFSRSPGEAGSPESVVPIYVRPPDADLHITKMRDPWA
jgi:tRNA threonylcarbamoyladenosine biosynthesis protein TsaB